MSHYTFIASDYELPEVSNPNVETITVREAINRGIEPHELIPWEEMNPDDRQNIQPKIRNHKNISLHDIDEMFNSYNENWENYNAIVIGGVLWQGIKFMI